MFEPPLQSAVKTEVSSDAMSPSPHSAPCVRSRWPSRLGLLRVAACMLPIWGSAVYTSSGGPPQEPTLLPNGAGADLTLKMCASCHPLDSFVGLRRSASNWNDSVTLMIAVGATVDDDQARVIVRYLSEVFGPNSPPLIDVNRATRDDLKKLAALDAAAIESIMKYRERHGKFKSHKQIGELLGADKFEKLKGYLVVRPKTPDE